jgi:hypothetical protein
MPTQSTTYNSRVTDESLEKRFRDTFRAQGGAELVDDLYAQGVIVPIVDFTAAATGQQLSENLQTAWDFSTGHATVTSTSLIDVITTAGFWAVDVQVSARVAQTGAVAINGGLALSDGVSNKIIFEISSVVSASANNDQPVVWSGVIFINSGQSLKAQAQTSANVLNIQYRQIATVNGDLVQPSGFTSS